jgi:hypothetical protein
VDKRRLDRSPGSRTAHAPREPAAIIRVSLSEPANDNGPPLSARVVEAGKWAVLLAALIGVVAYFVR